MVESAATADGLPTVDGAVGGLLLHPWSGGTAT
jgi:hypothetical protein